MNDDLSLMKVSKQSFFILHSILPLRNIFELSVKTLMEKLTD